MQGGVRGDNHRTMRSVRLYSMQGGVRVDITYQLAVWEYIQRRGSKREDHEMAAWLLHGVWFREKAGARNFAFFRVKWLQPAVKSTSCVCGGCGLGSARLARSSPHFNGCFDVVAYSSTLQLHGVLESLLAKCLVMAACLLYGVWFGEKAGARNFASFCVKWLQPAMKGTSCVRRVRAGFGQGLE